MTHRQKPLRRSPGTRIERRRILVVCEGENTEALYFDGVRRTLRLSTASIRVLGLGGDPTYVVRRAVDDRDDYDEVWCVFDVEAPRSHANLADALALAERKNVNCAISNPCFELWLVLHFRDQHAYVENDAIQHQLVECRCAYDRKHKNFDFAMVWATYQTAMDRAAALDARQIRDHPRVQDRNPWTSVHKLVDVLLKLGESRP